MKPNIEEYFLRNSKELNSLCYDCPHEHLGKYYLLSILSYTRNIEHICLESTFINVKSLSNILLFYTINVCMEREWRHTKDVGVVVHVNF